MSYTFANVTKDEVFPDVIDAFDPTARLREVFPTHQQEVDFGDEIPVPYAQEEPEIFVNLLVADPSAEYTLVVTDPDAPSRTDKTYSEFAHCLITDLKLDANKVGDWQKLDLSKGRAILPYFGPAPPANTGLHRYVFLLFKKTEPELVVNGPANDTVEGRCNWGYGRPGAGVRDWLKDTLLEPVAINFFNAQVKN